MDRQVTPQALWDYADKLERLLPDVSSKDSRFNNDPYINWNRWLDRMAVWFVEGTRISQR